jgi:hypothetical protein
MMITIKANRGVSRKGRQGLSDVLCQGGMVSLERGGLCAKTKRPCFMTDTPGACLLEKSSRKICFNCLTEYMTTMYAAGTIHDILHTV